MKRLVFSLIVAGGLVLTAAHIVNAAPPPECGKSYAFQVHGAEPSTTNDAALHYIVGVGQITFATGLTSNGGVGTSCSVSHLEMIYNDNDIPGFSAGPTHCEDIYSMLGTGAPCFDGGDHEAAPGSLTLSTIGPGGATLSIDPSFTWINGVLTSGDIPLSFTLYATTGASTVTGTSVAPPGPTLPGGTPPANPVLTIVMQKQSTTVVLPVTGPNPNNGGNGVAPYLGRSVVTLEGFSAPSADPYSLPITGAYSSAVGESQIFSNSDAGGTLTFNINDNVGNTYGTQVGCSYLNNQEGNFGDGTNNDLDGTGYGPPESPNCQNPTETFLITDSRVQWGATDTSSYWIVTGSQSYATELAFVFAGEMVIGTSNPSATPPGIITNLVVPQTLVAPKKTTTGYVKMTNTSAKLCDAVLTMPPASDGTCSLSMVSFPGTAAEPFDAYASADTPSTQYATTSCTCTTSSPADSVSSTLTLTSIFGDACPLNGTTSYTITCKN